MIQEKKTILVLNKSDLEAVAVLPETIKDMPRVVLSAKHNEGLDKLSDAVSELFSLGAITQKQDAAVVNLRHKQAICEAEACLKNALETMDAGMPLDLMSVDLRMALEALGTITGQTVSDEIVDEIFSRFCLGK